MAQRILGDKEFSQMMKMHIADILELLMQRGQFFSILTNVANVTFEPELPDEIKAHFKPITLFVVAEYTFESSSIDDEFLYFEAGFGQDNVGSLVSVPLSAIVQILIDETPIFINLSIEQSAEKRETKVKKSTNIFLSNPENRELIKKKN
jgi:hypothetical protein